ncbi:MAG: hypothetical protein Q4D85_01815 [Corynebacterium sp.]|uniref:lysoplasmalogenase family protein n=1 Tax=Corynebacterium sp. TaxID=1720 RepID=UPI0026DCAE96|nr:lysoplasmalogenase family protein [Corynebacterium sp.]MDO5097466.1 hypothetical protein [Corynebacterium sp.]
MKFFNAVSLAATATTSVAKLCGGKTRAEKLAKPLIVSALMAAQPHRLRDPLFVIGAAAHLAGDIVLLRDGANLRRGALCFGLGHAAFIARRLRAGYRPAFVVPHLAAMAVAAPLVRDAWLITYGALLASYSSLSHSLGGPLFMLSDALIDLKHKYPHPGLDFAVITTYGLAQYLLLGPEE